MSETKACSEEECDRKHYGKGLCNLHYMKLYRSENKGVYRVVVKDQTKFWEFVVTKLGISGGNERLVKF